MGEQGEPVPGGGGMRLTRSIYAVIILESYSVAVSIHVANLSYVQKMSRYTWFSSVWSTNGKFHRRKRSGFARANASSFWRFVHRSTSGDSSWYYVQFLLLLAQAVVRVSFLSMCGWVVCAAWGSLSFWAFSQDFLARSLNAGYIFILKTFAQ